MSKLFFLVKLELLAVFPAAIELPQLNSGDEAAIKCVWSTVSWFCFQLSLKMVLHEYVTMNLLIFRMQSKQFIGIKHVAH